MEQIEENPKMIRGLSFLIAERNNMINSKTDEKSGRKYIDYLNVNLTNSFAKILAQRNERSKFRSDLIQRIKMKDSKVAERNRKINKPNHFWRNLIIIGGVVVVGVLVYKHRDKIFKKKDVMSDGGTPIPNLPPPPTPVATPPPVPTAPISTV